MKKLISYISISLLVGGASARAITLVTYDLPVSTTTIKTVSGVAATGVVAGDITMASGLTNSSSSNGWRAGNYSTTGTDAAALDAANTGSDYFAFSMGASSGYNVTLNGIGTLSFGVSSTGPKSWALLSSSTSAFTSYNTVATYNGGTGAFTNSVAAPWTTALAAAPITINAGNTMYFRIVGYGSGSNTGTGGMVGTSTADFTLLGNVQSLIRNVLWTGGSGTWDTSTANWSEGGSATTFAAGNDVTVNSGGTLNVASGGVTAGSISVSGANNTTITGGGLTATAIVKSGNGTLNLNTAGSYASGITVDGGTVQASVDSAISGNVSVNAGTTLDIGSTTNTVATLSVSDGSISGGGKITATSTTVSASAGSNNTIAAEISGAGSLTKGGTGTTTLSGANSYTGDTVISGGGVLQTSGNERISDASILKPGTGSTLRLGGNETVRALDTSATSGVIDLQGNTLTIGAGSTSNSYSGQIIGTGALVKIGSGIQSVTNNYTFSGGTTLKEGSFRMQGSGSRSTNAGDGTVTLVNSAFGTGTLTIEGGRIYSSSLTNSATAGRNIYNSIAINGDFALGNNDAAAGGPTGDITVSTNVTGAATTLMKNATVTADSVVNWYQNISGSGFGLTKSGTNQVTFYGNNALDSFSVAQGRADLRGANTLNSVNVANGAVLGYGNTNAALGSAVINLAGGSTLGQIASMGTTTADRTLGNTINIQGDVALGTGSNANYLGGTIDLNGGTRTLNMVNSTYLSGQIQNGGLNIVASNKTVSFTGASTYSGGTTLATSVGGTTNTILVNNTTGSAFGSGSLLVQSGNVLGGSGSIAGATILDTGSSLRPGNSPGVLTFGSDVTFNSGASVVWELWGNTDVNSPVAFDQVLVGGNLAFLGSNIINLDFGTTLGGSLVNWSDTFWDSQRSWTAFSVTGTTTGFENVSLNVAPLDAAGTSLASARAGASFTVNQVGNDVVVNYVPEPSTSALLALGLASWSWFHVRRRKDKATIQ